MWPKEIIILKILIVEDTTKLAKSLSDHFTLTGHNSDIASTIESASELITLTHYDPSIQIISGL